MEYLSFENEGKFSAILNGIQNLSGPFRKANTSHDVPTK